MGIKRSQKSNFTNKKFWGIKIDDEIYFLGGRNNGEEKMFKFNTTSENIEICKQENTKLKPMGKIL